MAQALRIDRERLWARLQELAEFGSLPSGGVTRLVYTPAEAAARERVAEWLRALGLAVRTDAALNLIARWEGRAAPDPAAAGAAGRPAGAVAFGSHLDTVPEGGRFDGALGVVAAVEAVAALKEAGFRPARPVEVLVFVNEEGARYGAGLMGSRIMAGRFDPAELDQPDADGVALRDALAAAGGDPAGVPAARRRPEELHAFLELHIEQAALLEREGLPVGVVEAIAGPAFTRLVLDGRADHAGATPMDLRQDALAAAAEVILAVERLARQSPSGTTVGTVGWLRVRPNAANVIPGRVELTLDVRDADLDAREWTLTRVSDAVEAICARRGVRPRMVGGMAVPPVPAHPAVLAALEGACRTCGLPVRRMVSGAAHDAMIMAGLAPMGMLFVRSRDGLSHNPAEYSSPEDCAAGAAVLAEAVRRLAGDA